MKKKGTNKDNIFNLFEDNNVKDVTSKTRTTLNDFIKTPYAKIGMFTKLILNHEVFHKKLQKFLKEEEPNYNSSSTKEAGDYSVFNRSWSYIKDINIDNPDHIEGILDFNPRIFYKALQDAILYFENCEQYEKCAHLLKIQHLVKKF
tara:strand:+ start:269 stop:709 length:441 start_codon:yes stop_codon:yes gene_type:complete